MGPKSLLIISFFLIIIPTKASKSMAEKKAKEDIDLLMPEKANASNIFRSAIIGGIIPISNSEDKCNRDLVVQFLKPEKQMKKKSFKVSARYKAECPRIERACCHFSEYQELKRQYFAGKASINRTLMIFNRIIQILKETGHDAVFKKVLDNKQMMQLNGQELSEEQSIDSIDLHHIFIGLDDAKIKFNLVTDFYLRYFSAVACELCNAANHKHVFKNPATQKIHINFSRERATEYIKMSKLFSELNRYLIALVKLFNHMSCNNDKKLNVPLESSKYYFNKILRHSYCEQHMMERSVLNSEDLCNDLLVYFNSFTRSTYIENIAQIVHYGNSSLLDCLNDTCSRVSSIKKIPKERFPRFLKSTRPLSIFDEFKIVISSDEGWNLLNRSYASI
jgi:hypothetical protein